MKAKAKIGLLPLYLKLYDDNSPNRRVGIEAFHALVAGKLSERSLEVINVPVCRVKEEVDDAVTLFEREGVDAVVTLHLSYSPSLEASYALARTALPIIVLATTPDFIFDAETSSGAAVYNQGILGVQDMCNMLLRSGKHFEIFAGHHENSDVLDRVAEAVTAAKMSRALKTSRVGIIGDPFKNMGDFQLGGNKLKELLGIELVKYDASRISEANEEKIKAEYKRDTAQYLLDGVPFEKYRDSAAAELSARAWIKNERLNAVTVNFHPSGGNSMKAFPFSAAGKAMRDGIGYAGEGDAITAALVGVFLGEYERTSFTEMHCPDWRGSAVFVSRPGEQNPRCINGRAQYSLKKTDFNIDDPVCALTGTYQSGDALLVSLSPQYGDRFKLIVCEGRMLASGEHSRMFDTVSGWFKPSEPLDKFLCGYSRNGGIHHTALIYDGDKELLRLFAAFAGFEYCLM